LTALDWQHTAYRYSPERHALAGLALWPVPVFPDGDYYIHFVPGLEWGTFGHPWQQSLTVTASAARLPLARILNDYAWLWQDDGLEVPIEPNEYYVVAVEANGNLTLAHRSSGHLLLFAADHAFEGVTPLPGCPPYSLVTIDDAPDLAAWIELCADAWSHR
jgi:hypothetical protein